MTRSAGAQPMETMIVTIAPGWQTTRILAASEERDVLKAVLPPASNAHPRAATTLLEGLALWQQRPLSVALCVDERDACSEALQLYDALGDGVQQLHFEVAVVPRAARGGRGARLGGLGDFRDLRPLVRAGGQR